jgi:hypothetical protein
MPTTGYSQHYRRELDVEQLLGLIAGQETAKEQIDAALREWIRSDIQCPSCGSVGAQVVRVGHSPDSGRATRQAHFRFVRQDGTDAHRRYCEFHGSDDGRVVQVEGLINFAMARTLETRHVRELVCKAIERQIFGQPQIRAMRQWFYDLREGARFRVSTTSEMIDWLAALQKHQTYRRWVFHPVQAELPDFNWQTAAKSQFTEENLPLFDLARSVPFMSDHDKRRACALVIKDRGQDVWDVRVLQPYYDAAIELATFIASNVSLEFGKVPAANFRFRGAPAPLLALCALMLSISNWDMNAAIGRFGHLIAPPAPADLSLGNVIGLNPFHDYTGWRIVILAADIAGQSPKGIDYATQLRDIESRMREQHRLWRHTSP